MAKCNTLHLQTQVTLYFVHLKFMQLLFMPFSVTQTRTVGENNLICRSFFYFWSNMKVDLTFVFAITEKGKTAVCAVDLELRFSVKIKESQEHFGCNIHVGIF